LYYPLGYKPALDGLRAFAVLPVLLFHGGAPGFQWGYVGVDLFFVLSGYLITTILLKEYTQTGRISLISFYRRRALRLLPALAALCLAFLLYAAVVLRNLPRGLKEVSIVVFYFGNWTRAFRMGLPYYLGHTWTLAIEEQFYLLWPVVLLAVLALNSRVTSALRLIVLLIIVITCWRVILTSYGANADRLYNGTDTRADALLIGAALALALAAPMFLRRIAAFARSFWLPATAIIVVVPIFFPWNDRHMFIGGFSVVALAAATILTAALDGGMLAQILSNPAFVWVGQRSYGLYIWHYPIMLVGHLYFHIPLGFWLTAIEVGCTFAVATLSYKFIERPFLERRYVNRPMEHARSVQQISN
jgi:peptidoglycan/LPS O-acetylase OafA/YrhL